MKTILGNLISLINETKPHLYYCTYSRKCIGVITSTQEHLMTTDEVIAVKHNCIHQDKCFNFECEYHQLKKVNTGDKEFTEEQLTNIRKNLDNYSKFYNEDKEISKMLKEPKSWTIFTGVEFKKED